MTETLSVRIDAKLKKDTLKLANELGVPMGLLVSTYLKQFLREKKIVIEQYDDLEWTPELEKVFLEAKNDYKKGKNIKTLSFSK